MGTLSSPSTDPGVRHSSAAPFLLVVAAPASSGGGNDEGNGGGGGGDGDELAMPLTGAGDETSTRKREPGLEVSSPPDSMIDFLFRFTFLRVVLASPCDHCGQLGK